MKSKPHVSVGVIGSTVLMHTNTIVLEARPIESLPCETYQAPSDVHTIARDYEITLDAARTREDLSEVFIKKENYKDRAMRNQPWYAKFRKGKRK